MQTDRLLPPSSTSIREFVVQPPNSLPVAPLADLAYPLVVLTDLDLLRRCKWMHPEPGTTLSQLRWSSTVIRYVIYRRAHRLCDSPVFSGSNGGYVGAAHRPDARWHELHRRCFR